MKFQTVTPDKSVSLFVKNIWVFENDTDTITTSLPFFADGFPGLMVQQSEGGLIVNPHAKIMPEIFLYGQTIAPIELEITGRYSIVIFQLYPFVLRTFFKVIPESINDNCYYLEDNEEDIAALKNQLSLCKTLDEKITSITRLLLTYFEKMKQNLDLKIRQAIEIMILSKGQKKIGAIGENISLNIRTIERRFKNETGISPKQFAQIIQFQAALKQLTIKDYTKLNDIVYRNGYADQSHFIKVFKAFTGKTPKAFKK
jgi:AraC-like DNA-binding protein